MPGRKTIKDPNGPPGTIRSSIFFQLKGLVQKPEIYQKLEDENPSFIGRIVGDLLREAT